MIERYFDDANSGENYPTALRHGGLIFVSGQLGTFPGGPETDFEAQLRLALHNLISAVEASGGDRGTLLKVTGYLADVEYFPVYHQVYREVIGTDALPARTTIQVGRFDHQILVELDAIAAVREESLDTSPTSRQTAGSSRINEHG